jgi:ferredoxin/flavodoxin
MKVAIIVFSPSGSTLKVGKMLRESLLGRNAEVQLINIARCEEIFVKHNIEQYLEDTIETHDLLCVGGPVYTHHLHYNVQDLIRRLPRPGNGWGKLAVPFITWGGINSGVALQEAGNLLRKSGRTVVSGMKVNSFHCFSSLKKISEKVNEGMPGDEALPLIEDLATRIIKLADVESQECPDASRELDYQSRKVKIKAKLIFREKFWQRHIYPKLVFHHDKCTKCGLCAKVCSVQRIEMNGDGPIIAKENPECIHCVRCISNCPVDAIDFDADWTKWNRVLAKAAAGLGPLPSNEFPKSAVYPIRN